MFLPEFCANLSVFARCARRGSNLLSSSTKTCINGTAGIGAYPRKMLVYTIRTPSPDGRHRFTKAVLPVSLWRKPLICTSSTACRSGRMDYFAHDKSCGDGADAGALMRCLASVVAALSVNGRPGRGPWVAAKRPCTMIKPRSRAASSAKTRHSPGADLRRPVLPRPPVSSILTSCQRKSCHVQ